MIPTSGYAVQNSTAPLAPFQFERRDLGPKDILIDILYCGVCHSDIHQARNEWQSSVYPMVPGHEIVGKVKAVGSDVTQYKLGDTVGVGCFVDACRTCSHCHDHLEQYCDGKVLTYNSHNPKTNEAMQGGYADQIVVDQDFVLRIPDNLDLAATAPLLCAGITTYSPLRHWQVAPGKKVGVVGLGGLGHMAIKLASAMGAHVVVFTTSPSKKADALALGADDVVLSKEAGEFERCASQLDLIIDTAAAPHDLDPYLSTLKRDGTMVLLGIPDHPHPSPSAGNLIFARRRLAGSLVGGIKETQEMLDFCGKHQITADIEPIAIKDINQAYDRMLNNDVKYRFVIDLGTLSS